MVGMSERLNRFKSFSTHAWFKRVFKRLSREEIALAERTLLANDAKGKDDFERFCNRLFLDDPDKPKHWMEIRELLANANT